MAFLNIEGRSVAYRLLGAEANPLVVLSHPLGMSQAVWDDVLPALLPRYRVLTWDLPGHGASQAWGDGPITPAELAKEAIALADHAGVLQALDQVLGFLLTPVAPGFQARPFIDLAVALDHDALIFQA